MPIVREVDEMLYQWEEPFFVDGTRFRARFGLQSTALDEAARATLAWAKETYAPAGGSA